MGGGSSCVRIRYIVREDESPQEPPPMDNVSMLKIVENHLSCGVCQYPCHEMVVTSCGHKFCKVCLENDKDMGEYRTFPQQCPKCTKDITSTVRLPDDDRMIESIMDNFASDLTGLHASAQQRKEAALLKAENRKQLIDRHIKTANVVRCCIVLAAFGFLLVSGVIEYREKNPEEFNERVAKIKTVIWDTFYFIIEAIDGIILMGTGSTARPPERASTFLNPNN